MRTRLICDPSFVYVPFFSVVSLFLISIVSLHAAPATGHKDPEILAEKSLAAFKQNRLKEFAGYIHVDERKRLKEFLLLIATKAADKGQAKQVLQLFGPKHTLKSIKDLNDHEFLAAFLGGMLRLQKDLKETLQKARFTVLGHMLEGKDKAHVVYNINLPTDDKEGLNFPSVVSMKKSGEGWALKLTDDVEGALIKLRVGLLSPDKAKARARITDIKVLGYIPNGKNITYVIYRMFNSVAGMTFEKTTLWEVSKDDPAWAWVVKDDRAALTADLKKDFRVGK